MKPPHSKISVLVVDDDDSMHHGCRRVLEAEGYRTETAEDGLTALNLLQQAPFDIAVIDLVMPGMDGLELLAEIKRMAPETEVVMITGHATVETAVQAMKNGAYDYLQKPFVPKSLLQVIEKAVAKKRLLETSVPTLWKITQEEDSEMIIGESRRMQEVFELMKKVAPTDSTVLINGESGTGKELIAKAVHYHSLRSKKPFMAVDCSTLMETLFESELFGHEKGSFTGAIETKHGSFELAEGGTFFFDEIGNISLNMQARKFCGPFKRRKSDGSAAPKLSRSTFAFWRLPTRTCAPAWKGVPFAKTCSTV